ncbi:MAG TPA: recombinase A [Polyangiaceae bacterium]
MAAAEDVEALLEKLGSKLRLAKETEGPRPLPLDWPELAAALPDGGLPRGVVELAAARSLGGATSLALAAVRAGQQKSEHAWCAWIDPEDTLHAPGVVAAGVDLGRLLVVRPPRALLGKVAVKLVGSGAFEVVAVDVDAVPGARAPAGRVTARRGKGWSPELLVRKLSLAAEPTGSTVLLLTDASLPRAAQWPVALRLELSRPDACSFAVRVAKDRRGRVGPSKTVPFLPLARAAG